MEDSLKESPSNFVDPGNYHLRRRKKIRWSEHDKILKGRNFTATGHSVVVHIDTNQSSLLPINKWPHQDLLKRNR